MQVTVLYDDIPEFPLDANLLAEGIGIDLDNWNGRCDEISRLVLKYFPIANARLARGHWDDGDIQQHSWIVLEDGRILDPTRWCLEKRSLEKAYIYLGVNDYYDEGSFGLEARMTGHRVWSALMHGNHYENLLEKRDDTTLFYLHDVFFDTEASLDRAALIKKLAIEIEYIVTSHPSRIERVFDKYKALETADLKSLIKIDAWRLVVEPEKLFVDRALNLTYRVPDVSKPSQMTLFLELLSRFVSIEELDIKLEEKLDELGYSLDEYHDALNKAEYFNAIDKESLCLVPRSVMDILCLVCAFVLGEGYGQALKVERYAASRGYSLDDMRKAFEKIGNAYGVDMSW